MEAPQGGQRVSTSLKNRRVGITEPEGEKGQCELANVHEIKKKQLNPCRRRNKTKQKHKKTEPDKEHNSM